jgi:hypothetical protein
MSAFMMMLGRLLTSLVGEMAIRALLGTGVALATYSLVVQPGREAIRARFAAAGPLVDYVGWLGIDVAVTIILSAWIGRTAVSASKAFFVKRAG